MNKNDLIASIGHWFTWRYALDKDFRLHYNKEHSVITNNLGFMEYIQELTGEYFGK